jgi:methionine sulfoxide reductase heme-binding subunit
VTAAAAATLTSAPLWFLTRATGVVAFVLLTVTVTFGIAATKRALAGRHWPRFATQELHRNLSLLAMGVLFIHITTTMADSFVHVGWLSFVVPFTSPYRTVSVAAGTIAFDLILLVIATSLLRHRLPLTVWRNLHRAVYAAWPMAAYHFWQTGTDAAHGRFGLWILAICSTVVGLGVAVRLSSRDEVAHGQLRSVGGVR